MTTAIATMNHDLSIAGPVGSLDGYIQAAGRVLARSRPTYAEDRAALAD